MELIFEFYWPNIIAASLLIFIFSHIGSHLFARNKAIEVMLLGQEFQTGILFSAFFLAIFQSIEHDDHGLHIEFLITGAFVLSSHSFYLFIHKKLRHLKVEGAVSLIVLLILVSQLIVSLNPGIEFHMIKSLMGDIVTVSKSESIFVSIFSCFSILLYFFFYKDIEKDSLDFALFSKQTHKRFSYILFNLLVFTLMFLSIHLLGTIFTLGVLFIPAYVLQFFYLTKKLKSILFILLGLSSPLSFYLLSFNDRVAPTLLIILVTSVISTVYGFLFNRSNS